MTTNINLVDHLKNSGVLVSKNIEMALLEVDRANFVRKEDEKLAYYDEALPIGYNQTISQPLTVVFMLELLEVKDGHKVMDIGAGSGWQSCILGQMVGKRGCVHAIEIIPEICRFGEENCSKFPEIRKRINFHCMSAKGGLPDISDSIDCFDRIICAAEVEKVPQPWRDRLENGGIMVYPMDKGIYKEIKGEDGKYVKEFYPGFAFVPFV